MKKLKPHEVRGKAAEERFLALARSLKINTVTKIRVRSASRRLDQNGVDFIVYLCTESAQVLKVPVQVKSSFGGVLEYRRKYREYIDAGVVTIVVNDFRTDEHIINELTVKFMNLLVQDVDFTEFFALLRTKRVRTFLQRMPRVKYLNVPSKQGIVDDHTTRYSAIINHRANTRFAEQGE